MIKDLARQLIVAYTLDDPRDVHTNLNAAEREALALLNEECSEVGHVVSKCLRHGMHSKDPLMPRASENIELLQKELGDVLAAIEIAQRVLSLDKEDVMQHRDEKLLLVGEFLHRIDVTVVE